MWWIAPIVLVLLRLLAVEASLVRAKVWRGTLVFRTGLGSRILFGVGASIIAWQLVKGFSTEEHWVSGMLTAILLFICFAWPSTITIDSISVSQHRWWRPTSKVRWGDVTGIERNSVGDMQVFGKTGQQITFTRYHSDPARFESEVKVRAGLDRTIDASQPPTLRV